MLIVYLYIFAIGACVGSFLTAWTWRLWNGRSITEKHSVCPQCQHALGPLDLVPVLSYAFLLGRCRYCHKHISIQYPLIELATGILFVAAIYKIVSLAPALDVWLIFSLLVIWIVLALLVALFVFDLKWGYLPDIWTLGGSILLGLATIVAALLHKPLLWQPNTGLGVSSAGTLPASLLAFVPTLAAGLLAALFFLLIIWGSQKLLHKEGMGFGDVKLALFMGLLLGFPGIVVALYLAFILGAVLSLLLLAAKQKSFGQAIPFGPFLVVGTLLAWWLTPQIIDWYQQLLI